MTAAGVYGYGLLGAAGGMHLLQIAEQTPTGDIEREDFVAWLGEQSEDWTVPGESVSHNPLGAWWHDRGYCLVQVGFERAILNGGTVDEEWLDLGAWGAAFLDACAQMAGRLRRALTKAEVLLAVADADWACEIENAVTRKLDRKAILAEAAASPAA